MFELIFYVVTIAVSFIVFRQSILENSNVKILDFQSGVIVFLATLTIPNSLIFIYKTFVNFVL